MALRHSRSGAARAPGRALVEVFNPDVERDGFTSPHTVVMIVTDDMPFLVDSLGVVFSKAERRGALIIHPVLCGEAGRSRAPARSRSTAPEEGARSESWQLYEIDRQTDPRSSQRCSERLETALADVRLAVEDWMPMRERVRALSEESAERSAAAAQRKKSPKRARCSTGWKRGISCSSAIGTIASSAATRKDRLVPDVRSGLGILRAGSQRAAESHADRPARRSARSRARRASC